MSVRCTKAEKIARFFDMAAGWSDHRQYQMQKDAAALLRKQQDLLLSLFSDARPPAELLVEVSNLLRESEESDV